MQLTLAFAAHAFLAQTAVAEPAVAEAERKPSVETAESSTADEMLVIGETADFLEKSSGIQYLARIDTGATTCSIHAEDIKVEGGKEKMTKNVGKKVTFTLIDSEGERKQVESTIADTVRVKTSDKDKWERRYKVWLELLHNGVSRRVHVSLNDRKHMEYQLLIGRNYLRGRFLVDVAEKRTPLTADGAASEKEEKEGLRTADEDSTGTDEPAES